jgi:hypothetical protein
MEHLVKSIEIPEARDQHVTDADMQRLLGGAPKRFAFMFRPGKKFGPETQALQWEHARNMFALLQAGRLASVTALMDGGDLLGVGVMEAASEAEGEALLCEDPAVRGGRLCFEISPAASFMRGEV